MKDWPTLIVVTIISAIIAAVVSGIVDNAMRKRTV